MHILFPICFLSIFSFGVPAELQDAPQTTTWFVVRHADRVGDKDQLTEAGVRRANQLRDLMKTLRVSAVYSTDTVRTQTTAQPTAKALGLSVTTYGSLNDSWFEKVKSKHIGKAVLIVGHSNTAGAIAGGLGGKGDFAIDDDEYDSLFIVTTGEQGCAAVRLKYGDPPKPSRTP